MLLVGYSRFALGMAFMMFNTAPMMGDEPPRPCRCEKARMTNGWCQSCRVGYVAGLKIASHLLYETLDAHGHDVDPQAIRCQTCRDLVKTGGFCDSCELGYIDGQAYVSRLTYHVGRGAAVDVATISCTSCRSKTERWGWCESCKIGWVGNVRCRNKDEYDQASVHFDRLLKAVETLKRCETCAVAMVGNGRCLECGIAYVDGKPQNLKDNR